MPIWDCDGIIFYHNLTRNTLLMGRTGCNYARYCSAVLDLLADLSAIWESAVGCVCDESLPERPEEYLFSCRTVRSIRLAVSVWVLNWLIFGLIWMCSLPVAGCIFRSVLCSVCLGLWKKVFRTVPEARLNSRVVPCRVCLGLHESFYSLDW